MLYRDITFIDKNYNLVKGDINVENSIVTDIKIKSEGVNNAVLPPFVDIHIHGGYGVDVMSGSPDEIRFLSKRLYSDNVGAYMPTTVAKSRDEILYAAERIKKAAEDKSYAEIVGIHIEGPFISEKYKGIMEEKYIKGCDTSLYEDIKSACEGMPLRFTLAPECEGAEELCKYVTDRGDFVSIGHSGANRKECESLVKKGASSYTHIFNAMSPLHHRNHSVVEAALLGEEYTELICDFVHVSRECAEITARLKADKIILITDAIHAMGCEMGEYTFCSKRVYNDGISVKDKSGRLAGSILTMKKAYKNMSEITGEKKALKMAAENPARLLGLEKYGYIDIGKRIIL